MRRTTLLTAALTLLAIFLVGGLLLWQGRRPETAAPTPTPAAVGQAATATPRPTQDAAALPVTAAAYATANADHIGTLEVTYDTDGLNPHVTFSEDTINALIAPYVPELGNISNVELDLEPGAARLDADLTILGGIVIAVQTAGEVRLENGRLMLDVTLADLGGITPPAAAVDAMIRQVVPLVNQAIGDGLAAYAGGEPITITNLDVRDGAMTLGYRFAPPPTLTPTPGR